MADPEVDEVNLPNPLTAADHTGRNTEDELSSELNSLFGDYESVIHHLPSKYGSSTLGVSLPGTPIRDPSGRDPGEKPGKSSKSTSNNFLPQSTKHKDRTLDRYRTSTPNPHSSTSGAPPAGSSSSKNSAKRHTDSAGARPPPTSSGSAQKEEKRREKATIPHDGTPGSSASHAPSSSHPRERSSNGATSKRPSSSKPQRPHVDVKPQISPLQGDRSSPRDVNTGDNCSSRASASSLIAKMKDVPMPLNKVKDEPMVAGSSSAQESSGQSDIKIKKKTMKKEKMIKTEPMPTTENCSEEKPKKAIEHNERTPKKEDTAANGKERLKKKKSSEISSAPTVKNEPIKPSSRLKEKTKDLKNLKIAKGIDMSDLFGNDDDSPVKQIAKPLKDAESQKQLKQKKSDAKIEVKRKLNREQDEEEERKRKSRSRESSESERNHRIGSGDREVKGKSDKSKPDSSRQQQVTSHHEEQDVTDSSQSREKSEERPSSRHGNYRVGDIIKKTAHVPQLLSPIPALKVSDGSPSLLCRINLSLLKDVPSRLTPVRDPHKEATATDAWSSAVRKKAKEKKKAESQTEQPIEKEKKISEETSGDQDKKHKSTESAAEKDQKPIIKKETVEVPEVATESEPKPPSNETKEKELTEKEKRKKAKKEKKERREREKLLKEAKSAAPLVVKEEPPNEPEPEPELSPVASTSLPPAANSTVPPSSFAASSMTPSHPSVPIAPAGSGTKRPAIAVVHPQEQQDPSLHPKRPKVANEPENQEVTVNHMRFAPTEPVMIEEELRSAEYYLMSKAKPAKHNADGLQQNRLSRMLLYLESIVYFAMAVRALKQQLDPSSSRPYALIQETYELLRQVTSRFAQHAEGLPLANRIQMLSLRAQALFCFQLFALKQTQAYSNYRHIDNLSRQHRASSANGGSSSGRCSASGHHSGGGPDSVPPSQTPTSAPSTPSPASSTSSVPQLPPGHIAIPHDLEARYRQQLSILNNLMLAHKHKQTSEALPLTQEDAAFFAHLDNICGVVTLESSLGELCVYLLTAVHWLKDLLVSTR